MPFLGNVLVQHFYLTAYPHAIYGTDTGRFLAKLPSTAEARAQASVPCDVHIHEQTMQDYALAVALSLGGRPKRIPGGRPLDVSHLDCITQHLRGICNQHRRRLDLLDSIASRSKQIWATESQFAGDLGDS